MGAQAAVAQKVANLVIRYGKVDENPDPEKDIYGELGVDSVTSIDLLLALENQFSISIDDVQFIKARTITQLAEMVSDLHAA